MNGTSWSLKFTTFNADFSNESLRIYHEAQGQTIAEHRWGPVLNKIKLGELGDIINLQGVPKEELELLHKIKDYHVISQLYYENHPHREGGLIPDKEFVVTLLRKTRFDPSSITQSQISSANGKSSLFVNAVEVLTKKTFKIFNACIGYNRAPDSEKNEGNHQVRDLVNELADRVKVDDCMVCGGEFRLAKDMNGGSIARIQPLLDAGFKRVTAFPQPMYWHIFAKNLNVTEAGNGCDSYEDRRDPFFATFSLPTAKIEPDPSPPKPVSKPLSKPIPVAPVYKENPPASTPAAIAKPQVVPVKRWTLLNLLTAPFRGIAHLVQAIFQRIRNFF